MSSEDLDFESALEDAFSEHESDQKDWFDDRDNDEADDNDNDGEEYFETETHSPNLTDEIESNGDLPETLDQVYADERGAQDEILSHFSDSSSDDDGWCAAGAMEEFRAVTEAMKSKKAAESNLNSEKAADADPEEPNAVPDAGSTDDANPESSSEDPNAVPAIEGTNDNVDPTPATEEPGLYEIDVNRKPWLRYGHRDGAILPVAGWGDDHLYLRDARFFKNGEGDLSRRTGPQAHTEGKPSLLGMGGTLERTKHQLHRTRSYCEELQYDQCVLREDLHDAEQELKEAKEEVGMLKHAVDTSGERVLELQSTVESREKSIEKLKEVAKMWKDTSEKWEKAFEKQRPLADAERERQEMIEAGVEFHRSVETQTSPVEVADTAAGINTISALDSSNKTDHNSPDVDKLVALTRERDELLEENKQVSAKVQRLQTLLENMKTWTEDQSWTPKEPTATANIDPHGKTTAIIDTSEAISRDVSPPESGHSQNMVQPLNSFGSPQLSWPEKWIEREEKIRKSRRWIQAKNECAAQLNAWEKLFWASARAGAPCVVA